MKLVCYLQYMEVTFAQQTWCSLNLYEKLNSIDIIKCLDSYIPLFNLE